jgi:hypothetical protein
MAMLDAPMSIARRETTASVVERTRLPSATADVAVAVELAVETAASSSAGVIDASHALTAATVSAAIASAMAPCPTTGASTLNASSPLEEVATSGEQIAGQRRADRRVVASHLVAQHVGAVGRGNEPDNVQRAIGAHDGMSTDR